MRPGPGGLSGVAYEVLQVTYANGDIERFDDAQEADLGDRNSATLVVRREHRRVLATLALANVRKWEWVDAASPIRPPVDLSWLSGYPAEQPEDGAR